MNLPFVDTPDYCIHKMTIVMHCVQGMEEQDREMKEQRFRFETAAEREDRIKREREQKEFGEVAVNFTLVKPHPEYVYHTVVK